MLTACEYHVDLDWKTAIHLYETQVGAINEQVTQCIFKGLFLLYAMKHRVVLSVE